ncbi:MAG: Gfo/Idh/MocA family oxidoreductase [Paracoccaceae bacterium]
MKNRVGLAVVGVGMAAKPHALALKALGDLIDVRGVYARSDTSLRAFCETYNFPRAHDPAALASDPSIDAVLLITPPNARTDLVSLFAGHGKHVLSEKPLERTTQAAQNIVDLCAKAGVSLGVVFQHRFRAASEALAIKLNCGDLGTIRLVRADVPWWRDQDYYDDPGRGSYARDGGGVLISQAIHTLDLMLSLTGPVTSVQAMCETTPLHRMEAEDFASGAVTFESGAVGSIFASTASFPGDTESLTFECDNGSARLKSGVLTIHWRDGRVETTGEEANTGGGADPMAFPFDWHKSLIADFAQSLQAGRAPRVTGAQAMAVHNLISAIEMSSHEGRRITLNNGAIS